VQLGALVALGCAIAAGALWIAAAGPFAPTVHEDGAGPLGSEGAPVHLSKANDPLGGSITSWTYGVRLCLLGGADPAILESVTPRATVGSGFRYLGASVRVFVYPGGHDAPIISDVGYPPSPTYAAPPFAELRGFQVTSPCASPPDGPYTELMIGLARDGEDGGGWSGVDIAYTVGGMHRVLRLDRDLLICGRSVDLCQPPG
jgi:hypothetical protein